MLGGQVCYLPNEQGCPIHQGYPITKAAPIHQGNSMIAKNCISPYWAGNKPALPAFLA